MPTDLIEQMLAPGAVEQLDKLLTEISAANDSNWVRAVFMTGGKVPNVYVVPACRECGDQATDDYPCTACGRGANVPDPWLEASTA